MVAIERSDAQQATKRPNRTVYADDLVVREAGQEYRPHAGEAVVFRARIRPADLSRALSLQSLAITSSAEETLAAERTLREFLAARIVSTSWTDDEGSAYETVEAMLSDADLDELGWLITHVIPDRSADQGEA